jgi:hypothetical protein
MKKKLLVLLLVFGTATYAQVGVGTLVPNASTILDVVANNKGVLIPRVSLKNTTDVTTISNGNVESLLVYNTQLIADVKPGYYYWLKNKWNKIVSTDDVTTSLGGATLIDNGNGTFTYTNDKGGITLIDVPTVMAAKTKNTFGSAVNTLTSNVNGVSVTAPIVNSNILSATGSLVVSTVNGVASNALDLNAATTNVLKSAVNTLTSTVNGVSVTAPIVNTNTTSLSGVNLTNTVNGLASTALDLTPAVKAATTHSLTLVAGVLTSTVNGVSPTANILATADNGLSVSAGNVKLGGLLTAATTVTTTATETLALSGLQQTITGATDNVVVADATTGVLKVFPAANLVSAITTKTIGYAALSTDETILVDATATAVTITLPAAASLLGKKFTIKKIDTSDNNVNVTSVAGTIDTVASISGGVWLQSWTVQSDGVNWFVINRS